MSRTVRIVVVVALFGAALVWAFLPSPVPADFVSVGRGRLLITVDEEGRTRVRDRYVVSAPLPGRMQRIELEPGDAVVAGKTVLARFLPVDPALIDVRTRAELEGRVKAAESAVGGARAERDRIRAQFDFAQSDLTRARQLVKERVLAQRELEASEQQAVSLERGLQSADFAVRTAEYQLQVARASLLQTRAGGGAAIPLYSPVNGVVLRRLQESESVVPTGQPLIEVGDVAHLEIVADLLSNAAVRVAPGQAVLVEHWGGADALQGRVRRIEPSGFTKISALGVEEQRVNVLIDFDAAPDVRRRIGDGYRVEVRVVISDKPDVLKIPASSLFRHGTDWAVFKVDGRVARRHVIQVGEQNGLEAEVVGGLSAGDTIIVYPSDAVRDGVKITPRS